MSAIFGTTFAIDATTRREVIRRLSHAPIDVEPTVIVLENRVLLCLNSASHAEVDGVHAFATGVLLQTQGADPAGAQRRQSAADVVARMFTTDSRVMSALADIDGQFSAAVVSEAGDKLALLSDRVGSNPLYYAQTPDGIAFASEYKALLALGNIPKDVDLECLAELHRSKSLLAGRTLFSSIRRVPAASIVEFQREKPETRRYWAPQLNVDHNVSLDAGAQELATRLVSAVARRRTLAAPSQLGLALSGGIDSMVLLGAAARDEFIPQTITIGDSPDDPEIEWAEKIAQHFGTRHETQILETGNLEADVATLVWALEDPIARTETLLTLQLSRIARRGGIEYLVRGDGADGLFGGMKRHNLLALGGRFPVVENDLWEIYDYTQTGARPARPLARIAAAIMLRNQAPPLPIEGVTVSSIKRPDSFGPELLNNVLITGPEHALPLLLQKAERPARIQGVRSTSPFTDREIMSFAYQIPSRFKNDGRNDKIILRRAARQLLPGEFWARPKHPQRIRESEAFCKQLLKIAEKLEIQRTLPERAPFDGPTISSLMQLQPGTAWPPEQAMRIWTLVLTEVWFRTFVDHDGAQPVVL